MLSERAATPASSLFSKFDFSGRHTVLVGVSGGSDSTALLLLLKDHLDESASSTRLVAVTVDHRLRQESESEAGAVGELCARAGIPHRILVWQGEKPSTGLAAAAREARYALLAKAAREEGADILLVAHTADDQAETVMMRADRGTGRGLSGMAPATLFEGDVWIVRPLLGKRRSDLREFLSHRRIDWIEDPSNTSPVSERARSRARLDGRDDRISELLERAKEAALDRHDLSARAENLIARHARQEMPGLIRMAPEFASDIDRAGAIHAFRLLLATAGGTAFLPDLPRATALFARMKEQPLRATLSRSIVQVTRSGVFLCRELRDLPPAVQIRKELIWDGRYRLVPPSDAQEFQVEPYGLESDAPDISATDQSGGPRRRLLEGLALAAQPAISRRGARVLLMASDSGWTCEPVVAPFGRYLLSFDLPAARALSKLVGAPPPPPPPFAGHNVGVA